MQKKISQKMLQDYQCYLIQEENVLSRNEVC